MISESFHTPQHLTYLGAVGDYVYSTQSSFKPSDYAGRAHSVRLPHPRSTSNPFLMQIHIQTQWRMESGVAVSSRADVDTDDRQSTQQCNVCDLHFVHIDNTLIVN